ncbi:MAG: type II toxin-antitoxin system RelB/DinJ family antitoxin [Finegoldia sp.]|nr:type II toxin-antitoxin system RelB/DinJ family antitoxin [Finegoldia sp.]
MIRSANLNIRIDPEIKETAEKILNSLGITPSNAINIFYRPVILNKGLAFDIRLPVDISTASMKEINRMLAEGLKDFNG